MIPNLPKSLSLGQYLSRFAPASLGLFLPHLLSASHDIFYLYLKNCTVTPLMSYVAFTIRKSRIIRAMKSE